VTVHNIHIVYEPGDFITCVGKLTEWNPVYVHIYVSISQRRMNTRNMLKRVFEFVVMMTQLSTSLSNTNSLSFPRNMEVHARDNQSNGVINNLFCCGLLSPGRYREVRYLIKINPIVRSIKLYYKECYFTLKK
jgi:hypothetical protein